MLKILVSVLIGLFGLLLFLLYLFSDTQTNCYKNMDEVQQDKAIIRGWIPGIIPKSAYEIEETHNLDINTVFGTFKYKELEEESFIKNLTFLIDNNYTMKWNNFIFKVDTDKNYVKFENTKHEMINKMRPDEYTEK